MAMSPGDTAGLDQFEIGEGISPGGNEELLDSLIDIADENSPWCTLSTVFHFACAYTAGYVLVKQVRAPIEDGKRDVDYAAFRGLIDYLLTDEGPERLPTQVVLDLMMLANTYGVRRLEQLCARALADQLSLDNAHEVRHCASLIGASHLVRAASKLVPAAPCAAAC